MKKYLLISFAVFSFCLAIAGNINAQTKSTATWPLTANQRAEITGNLSADSAMGNVLKVRDYTNAKMGGPLGANQSRWWMGFISGSTSTGVNWPASIAQENHLYIDFVVSPKPGFNFMVDSIKGSFGGVGTNNMRANLYFGGKDTSFSSLTPLNSTPYWLKQASYYASNPLDTNVAYYIGQEVKNGQKFRLRVYAWYLSTSTSNTKYICMQNIIIKGTTTAAVSVQNKNELPLSFSLEQNYPNPFNPTTVINFSLNKEGLTKLLVFNALGEEVAVIQNGFLNAGMHSIQFDASKLPSGGYIYRLITANNSVSKKMMLLK